MEKTVFFSFFGLKFYFVVFTVFKCASLLLGSLEYDQHCEGTLRFCGIHENCGIVKMEHHKHHTKTLSRKASKNALIIRSLKKYTRLWKISLRFKKILRKIKNKSVLGAILKEIHKTMLNHPSVGFGNSGSKRRMVGGGTLL